MPDTIRTYDEFWLHYLREHAKPQTRALHYVGTALALVCLIGMILYGDLRLLLAAAVAGYAFAWIGHFMIERNRPATFTHPLWSLISDFRMFFCWVTGRLASELQRAGVRR